LGNTLLGGPIRRVAFASMIGTTIEWYDFFLYGTASALVFNRLFFPNYDSLTGTLASFGTFAAGFVARPIGGIVCGHFGDRRGRKSMLILTLLIMGIATSAIGLLPTYNQIGIWAPILLITLRLAQGFAVGGEWAGAVLMAVEHSPKGSRGFYGSWPQIGVPAGLLASTVMFWQVSKLPEAAFLAWGWRLCFLVSVVMVAVGLFIRLAVMEPQVFLEVKQTRSQSRMPVIDVLRRHPKGVLLAMGAKIEDFAVFYLFTVFVLVYATLPRIGFSRDRVLMAVSIAAAIELFTIPIFGALSDRLGRRPVYLFGAILVGVLAFPLFWMIETSSTPLMILSIVLALPIGQAAMYGPQASFFSELFGTETRYSGASLGYQTASVLGGLCPILATVLLKRTGGSWAISLALMGLAVITTASVWVASETAHIDFRANSKAQPALSGASSVEAAQPIQQ